MEHVLLVGPQRPRLAGRGQDGRLRRELVVEVADVAVALDGGHERGLHLLGQQPVPVQVLTETSRGRVTY